jgi:ABC-type enterochelin transport system ATPase subunit
VSSDTGSSRVLADSGTWRWEIRIFDDWRTTVMKQIKYIERFRNRYLDAIVQTRIRKMFAYIGCDDIEFITQDDPFTEGNEHFVAYRTLTGSVKECDIDIILPEMFKEKNPDSVYKTIVIDMHEGRIMKCSLNEYGNPDRDEINKGGN